MSDVREWARSARLGEEGESTIRKRRMGLVLTVILFVVTGGCGTDATSVSRFSSRGFEAEHHPPAEKVSEARQTLTLVVTRVAELDRGGETLSHPVSGSPTVFLMVRQNDRPFRRMRMTESETAGTAAPDGPYVFSALLPRLPKGTRVSYYFEVRGGEGDLVVLPPGAPGEGSFGFMVLGAVSPPLRGARGACLAGSLVLLTAATVAAARRRSGAADWAIFMCLGGTVLFFLGALALSWSVNQQAMGRAWAPPLRSGGGVMEQAVITLIYQSIILFSMRGRIMGGDRRIIDPRPPKGSSSALADCETPRGGRYIRVLTIGLAALGVFGYIIRGWLG